MKFRLSRWIIVLLMFAQAAQAESFMLTQDTLAFNPAKPAEALGQFKAGSRVELGRKADTLGMIHVSYLAPDGNFISALCRAEDVGKAPPSGKPAVAANMPAEPQGGFSNSAVFKTIKFDLVGADGRSAASRKLAQSKYVLVYFSAHWCPPCRKFTPELVSFYNQNANKKFEVLFVSSDKSENEMAGYMKETSMPWLGVRYKSNSHSFLREKFSGSGIPCLVLLDENGNVLSNSYVNGEYVGPHKVLNDLKQKL